MTDKDLRIGDVVMTNGQTYGTKRGELYIVTKIDSEVTCYAKMENDDFNYKIGNYFKTKEQADKVAKEIENILNKHKND